MSASDSDQVRTSRFATPVKRKNSRRTVLLYSSSSSSSSESSVQMARSSGRKRPRRLETLMLSSSDSETAAQVERWRRKEERRSERKQEREQQRQWERTQNREIVSSLKKKPRSGPCSGPYPDRESASESEYVSETALLECEQDSFIDADDIKSLFASSDEQDEQDDEDFSWLQPLVRIPALSVRVRAVLGDEEAAQEAAEAAEVQTWMSSWSETARQALEGQIPEVAAGGSLLVEEEECGGRVTPLALLLLNEKLEASAVAQLPRARLAGGGSDLVRLAVRALTGGSCATLEQWLRWLRESGADLRQAAMETLEMCDDVAVLETVHRSGAPLVGGVKHGLTAVQTAAAWGRAKALEWLLSRLGPTVARKELERRATTSMGSTALHLAAVGETQLHATCVGLMLRHVADAGLADNADWPPLLYALQTGNKETVKQLLEFDLQAAGLGAPQLTRCMRLASDASAALPVRSLLRHLATDVDFFRSLNKFIARDVRVLQGPLKFLLLRTEEEISGESARSPVDLANKQRFLRLALSEECSISGAGASAGVPPRVLQFMVEREKVLECVLKDIGRATGERLRCVQTQVEWFMGGVRESGSGPGPQKEFESVVDGHLGEAWDERGQFLFPQSEEQRETYTALGRVLGMWLFQGKQLRVSGHIYPGVFEYVLSPEKYERRLEDLAELDEELYLSLKWLRDTDISDIEDTIVVTTQKDKLQYIQEQVRTKTWNTNFLHIREGFLDVFRLDEVAYFTGKELATLIGGGERNSVDVAKWQTRTTYSGALRPSDPMVDWFWDFVRKLSAGEQAMLLQFATGRFSLPENFLIAGSGRTGDPLPQASTCINLISLPKYSSRAALEEKLLVAIRCGATGYSFV